MNAMRLTVRHSFDFGVDRELVGSDLVRPEAESQVRSIEIKSGSKTVKPAPVGSGA